MLEIIIFSKDRACQLDSLIRSINQNLTAPTFHINILYLSTKDTYDEGYSILENRFPNHGISWHKEKNFAGDLRSLINGLPSNSSVLFFVDDNIVYKPVVLQPLMDAFTSKHLFISLRCSRLYDPETAPQFIHDEKYLEWKWNYRKKPWVGWNYPFSVDGHIFHTSHLQKLLKQTDFAAPNSLEGRMHRNRHKWWVKRIPKALAPLGAAVFNNPLNKVQAEGETWHQNVDIDYLNERYLNGFQINNQVLYSCKPTDVHFAAPVEFCRR